MAEITVAEKSFKRQLLLLGVAVAIVNTGFGIIFPIFQKLLVDVGGGDAQDLGVLAAVFGASYLVGSPIFGNIADRVGMKKVILIGLLGFSLSNFIYIFSTNLTHLYIARVVEGLFASAILPPAIALTSNLSPKESRGRYLGLIGASQTTGIIIGPILGGVLFDGFVLGSFVVKGSLVLPFYASALMGFIAFIWSYFQLPADRIPQTNDLLLNSEIKPKKDSLKIRINNTLKHQITVLPRPVYMFLLFVGSEMLAVLAWITIEPGFLFYFYDDLLLEPIDFGIFVGAFGVASVLGQGLLGNVSDKVGRKPVLIVGQLFSFLFYFSLPMAKTLNTLILSVVFVGIGSGLRDPALKAWLSDVTEEENRATVFGIESGLVSSSQIFGPIIGGYLYVSQGMGFLFFVAIGLNLANLILLTFLRFDSKQPFEIIKTQELGPIISSGR